MSEVVYTHVWAPADSAWSDAIAQSLGSPSAQHEFTAGGDTFVAVRWTCPNEHALEEGRLRRMFAREHAPELFGEIVDDQDRFWPRASFSLTEDPGFPDELVAPDTCDIVGGDAGLWIHFVDPSSDTPSTFTYEDAVAADVWSIEDSLLDPDGTSAGWWITTTPEPGTRPAHTHSLH